MPPFPSLTKTWHSEPYPAIDPTRPELSAKGKVVAITGTSRKSTAPQISAKTPLLLTSHAPVTTGAGGSIGSATTLAFAKAGASSIAIIGRRKEPLQQTKTDVEKAVPGTNVFIVQGDVSEADSIRGALGNVKKEFGDIDILICNAGYLSEFESLGTADPKEWWRGFETNVLGAFNCTRAFLSTASSANPILLEISTCPIVMPAMAKASSYIPSKLAATKVYETFAAENPRFEVVHVHPGVVYSDINVKSGITALDHGLCQREREEQSVLTRFRGPACEFHSMGM